MATPVKNTDPKAPNPRTPNQPVTPENPSQYEVLENPDALADRLTHTEEYVKKNRNILLGIVGAIALAIAGAFFYFSHKTTQESDAQKDMFQAVYYFEQDSLAKALNGDGQNMGLLKVADEYSGTKAANLAHFYIGVAYLKQGKFKEALDHLEDFSSDDLLLQARAYCLQGDAKMELNQPKEAAELYLKAANYKGNKYFSPQYLMKAGLALELSKDYQGALDVYNKIVNDYSDAPEAMDAKKYRARAEGLKG